MAQLLLTLPDWPQDELRGLDDNDIWDHIKAYAERRNFYLEDFEIAKLIRLAKQGISVSQNGIYLRLESNQ